MRICLLVAVLLCSISFPYMYIHASNIDINVHTINFKAVKEIQIFKNNFNF